MKIFAVNEHNIISLNGIMDTLLSTNFMYKLYMFINDIVYIIIYKNSIENNFLIINLLVLLPPIANEISSMLLLKSIPNVKKIITINKISKYTSQ